MQASHLRVAASGILLLLASALLAGGCTEGDGSGDAPQRGATPPMVRPEGRTPNPSRIREELRTNVELPDYYPDDAPIYPGAATNTAGRRRGRVAAVFSSQDSRDEIFAYVKAKLPSLGWADVSVQEMPNGTVIHAIKAEREMSVLVSVMDEGTEYELTMMMVAVDPPGEAAEATE